MSTRLFENVIKLADENATLAFGARLAGRFTKAPLLVFLEGELGAGKTTLVRGLLRGCGYKEKVVSPTYTLMENYDINGMSFLHLDLYRISDREELEFLGLRDRLPESIALVEWPERGSGWLPGPDLTVRLEVDGDGRRAELLAGSDLGDRIIAEWESEESA